MVGRTILHYRIVGTLGSGGMGVVFEAHDLKLDRLVALKFLPAELAADAGALERFQREARAASALNHPSICTIYAFEQAQTDEGPRAFLAMERLEGQSLDRSIAGRPLPVDVTLELGIQVADALDAAHSRGIVHRDIKPGNIFVQPRNRAKVLDFGLAKLAAARVGMVETMTADVANPLTSPGTTLGTVAYMSPEQARGDDLDARTDLFSFGAVLYEMCTGRAPFGGNTSAVIFQKILDKDPEPPRVFNPTLPPKLEEIVLKALEKDRDMRCQTAAELRADLKRLQRETSGRRAAESEASAAPKTIASSDAHAPTTAPVSSGAVLLAEAKRHKFGLGIAAVVSLAVLVAAGFGTYRWLIGDRPPAAFGQQMSMTPLTSSGAVTGCVSVSPDGRSIVYCERDAATGQVALRIRQVATGANIKLSDVTGSTTFSPDGNFVYVTQAGNQPLQGALLVIPALGGGEEPRRLLTDIQGAAAVSQDGERIAFVRAVVPANGPPSPQVIEVKRDGTEPRVVHAGRVGEGWFWPSSLAWSPDGRSIAGGYRGRDIGMLMAPALIDVATGKVQPLTDQRWQTVASTAWLRDGSGVIFTATHSADSAYQLWLVSHPGGAVKRITNDLHNYAPVGFDVDANGTIVARQIVSSGNLWISDANGDGLKRVTSGSGLHRVVGWMDGERVLYMTDAPERSLWSVSPDGGAPKRLPIDARGMAVISIAPGQNWIAYMTDGVPNIWRVNLDGSGRRQLTHTGYDRGPRVTLDGSQILYDHWGGGTPSVWRVPSSGGTPVRLLDRAGLAIPSPDGQRFFARMINESTEESRPVTVGIFRISDGALERRVDAAAPQWVQNPLEQWSADGQSMIYRRSPGGVSNLWMLRLDGGEPQQVTKFDGESIFSFAFSPDGKRIAMSRGKVTGDIVMIRNFR